MTIVSVREKLTYRKWPFFEIILSAKRGKIMARPRKSQTLTIPESVKSLKPTGHMRGKPVYADNPFISASTGFEIRVRKDLTVVANGLEIKDKESEEVAAGVVGTVKLVDEENFVKVYPSKIADIFGLPRYGLQAFTAVFLAVQKYGMNKAEIYLNYPTAKALFEERGIVAPSSATFSRGLKNLLDVGFLACSARGEHWYFTNPNIIFNGNRVRFVEEYRVRRETERLTETIQLPGMPEQ